MPTRLEKIISLIPADETDFLEDIRNINEVVESGALSENHAAMEIYKLCFLVFPDVDADLTLWQKQIVDIVMVMNGFATYFGV